MKKILFVDDEVQILKSLSRLFADTDYEIVTAENGEEALKILAVEKIDLILSDMRMPSMDGYELLCKIKELYPNIMRVILSGYADEKVVFKALQQNVAKFYVFKPWKNDMLLKLIDQIFYTEDILSQNNLFAAINNIDELPTIKSRFQEINKCIEEEADVSVISKVIERDQSISAKVLHIANSAFYGVETGSIKQAVSYLGLQNIKSLVLSTSIIDSMGAAGEYVEKLWDHAFLTNNILLFIYGKCMLKPISEIENSAGILHNIGSVFLYKYFSKGYFDMMVAAEKGEKDILELERSEYKVTHQEAGGYLLKWWDLPFPIMEAALYHHRPLDKSIINTDLVMAIHIAQKYAWDIMGAPQRCSFYSECFDRLGLNEEVFNEMIMKEDFLKKEGRQQHK